MLRREKAKHQQEFIHKSEKLENNLINILKKISKMKIIITELKRNINLDIVLQKNLLEELEEINAPVNILIRVENYEEGTVYYWSTETFHNRYDLMKELFNKFNDDDLDLQNLKKEDDPLWDEAKPVLLGYAFYRLEPVSYLMANESQISVVSPNGDVVGQITVDIIPHDENGYEYEEVPESPSELIGQTLYYKVAIMNLQNIAKNFSYDLHVRIEKKGKTAFEELFIARRDSVIREPVEEIKVIDEKQDKKDVNYEIKENYVNNDNKEKDEPVDEMMNKKNDKIDKNKQGNKVGDKNNNNNNKKDKNKDKKDNCNIY